ncbi:MAG: 30S ribosomal protein S24e [Candidatus Woesearchaeota archaeon]|nr:MAG: 30S ribosomal protein S24e [Candidatus Woesearchaeota archaeon]
MKVDVQKEYARPLLSRKEVEVKIFFDGATPKREEVREELAKLLKAAKELLIIKSIYNHFGEGSAEVTAFVYDNAEDMKVIEPKYVLKKHNLIAEEKKEEE